MVIVIAVLHFICVMYLFGSALAELDCDKGNTKVSEGVRGQIEAFPWSGVLRVHMHSDGVEKIAVSGVILIKDNYAIINANDVSGIPRKSLKQNGKVMFILDENKPWFSKVKDYNTHPEFEVLSYNTIALLELFGAVEEEDDLDGDLLASPICYPPKDYNTGSHLYVIGYTDRYKLLEKVIYKMQYVNKSICDEFYKRSNLTKYMEAPIRYQCAYAVNAKTPCSWDNGMAMASNATGYWVVIGITVGGPGCAAPARFIDLFTYIPWIMTASTLDDTNIDGRRRTNASECLGLGFEDDNVGAVGNRN